MPNIEPPVLETTKFFDTMPYEKIIYCTDSFIWHYTVKDFGLLSCSNISAVEIGFVARKHFTETENYGYHPSYFLEVQATCRDTWGGIAKENGVELVMNISYSVMVLGKNEATWDAINFLQVLDCLRRTAKCKYNKFGEPRPEEEIARLAASMRGPIANTNVTTDPLI